MPGTRTVPSRKGVTVRTTFCVTGSSNCTDRSRLTAGKPRMLIVRSLIVRRPCCWGSVAEGGVDLPEEGHALADVERNRLEDDLVIERRAGKQPGLGYVGEVLCRGEDGGDLHLHHAGLVGDELEGIRRQSGAKRSRRYVGRGRRRGQRR